VSEYNLFQGCCFEHLPNIPCGSIDMILADVPYGTTACKWDSVLPLDKMWRELKRIIKPNGAIVLTAQTPFDKVLGCSNIDMLRYEWIWEKHVATGFLNAKKMPLKAHENILVFYKKLPTYNPEMTHGYARRTRARVGLKSECYGKNSKKTYYDSTSRYPRSVIKFGRDKQQLQHHPTQKPIALMQYLIKTFSNEGETILDFTMGSGTTGAAAMITKRRFIGIELDSGYFEIAQSRILKASESMVQESLFA